MVGMEVTARIAVGEGGIGIDVRERERERESIARILSDKWCFWQR